MFPGDLFQITWELPPRRGDVLCRQSPHTSCGAFVRAAFQQSSGRERDMTLCRSCSTVGTAAIDDQFAALLPRSVRLGVGGGCMIGGVQAVGALPCASNPSARASRPSCCRQVGHRTPQEHMDVSSRPDPDHCRQGHLGWRKQIDCGKWVKVEKRDGKVQAHSRRPPTRPQVARPVSRGCHRRRCSQPHD
jgi:hypothetical protein